MIHLIMIFIFQVANCYDNLKSLIPPGKGPCVDVDQWKSLAIYDPNESFVDQIQENQNVSGEDYPVNRFTKLYVKNLEFVIYCKSKIPSHDSEYFLGAMIRDNKSGRYESITFKLLNGDKFYTSYFRNVSEVDNFLSHIHHNINVSYYDAMFQRFLFDADVKRSNFSL